MAIFDFVKKLLGAQTNSSNNTQKSPDREIDVSAVYGDDGEIFDKIPTSPVNSPKSQNRKQSLER